MDPVRGKYFKNIFIEVMVEGMTLSKRRGEKMQILRERTLIPACCVY